jgi:hypothetical protein
MPKGRSSGKALPLYHGLNTVSDWYNGFARGSGLVRLRAQSLRLLGDQAPPTQSHPQKTFVLDRSFHPIQGCVVAWGSVFGGWLRSSPELS